MPPARRPRSWTSRACRPSDGRDAARRLRRTPDRGVRPAHRARRTRTGLDAVRGRRRPRSSRDGSATSPTSVSGVRPQPSLRRRGYVLDWYAGSRRDGRRALPAGAPGPAAEPERGGVPAGVRGVPGGVALLDEPVLVPARRTPRPIIPTPRSSRTGSAGRGAARRGPRARRRVPRDHPAHGRLPRRALLGASPTASTPACPWAATAGDGLPDEAALVLPADRRRCPRPRSRCWSTAAGAGTSTG